MREEYLKKRVPDKEPNTLIGWSGQPSVHTQNFSERHTKFQALKHAVTQGGDISFLEGVLF